jgi:hypothetical protein
MLPFVVPQNQVMATAVTENLCISSLSIAKPVPRQSNKYQTLKWNARKQFNYSWETMNLLISSNLQEKLTLQWSADTW